MTWWIATVQESFGGGRGERLQLLTKANLSLSLSVSISPFSVIISIRRVGGSSVLCFVHQKIWQRKSYTNLCPPQQILGLINSVFPASSSVPLESHWKLIISPNLTPLDSAGELERKRRGKERKTIAFRNSIWRMNDCSEFVEVDPTGRYGRVIALLSSCIF